MTVPWHAHSHSESVMHRMRFKAAMEILKATTLEDRTYRAREKR